MNILLDKHRGLADSIWSGIEGSYAKAVGVDFHTKPGATQAHQKLTKDSSTIITALCKVSISVSDGSKLWFSATDGKIWRESSGTYTLKHTTTPAAGGAGCLGAAEFNGRIYWATESRLHYIAVASIGVQPWAAQVENNGTFTDTDDTYHPMAVQNNELFIGDKTLLASVDEDFVFNATRFENILTPHRVRVLLPFDADLLIGTIIADSVNYCELYRWDTIASNWQFADHIYRNGVRAGMVLDEVPVFAVGNRGHLMYYDGQRLRKWKRLPGAYTASAYLEIHPQSMTYFDDRAVIGVSNGSGNPLDEGVYDLGSYSADYPTILSLAFPLSEGVFTGITIGAVIVDGLNLYVAWGEGADFGVDKLDYTAKYASAYLESRVIRLGTHYNQSVNKFFALYESLNGGSLAISYKKNHAGSYTSLTMKDDDTVNSFISEDLPEARSLQVKLEFTVSGNNSPVVEMWGFSPTPTISNNATD